MYSSVISVSIMLVRRAPAIDTTMRLPQIPGGKKLIYNHITLPLTAVADFAALGETDDRFKVLDMLVKQNNGLWSTAAEKYLLENFGG